MDGVDKAVLPNLKSWVGHIWNRDKIKPIIQLFLFSSTYWWRPLAAAAAAEGWAVCYRPRPWVLSWCFRPLSSCMSCTSCTIPESSSRKSSSEKVSYYNLHYPWKGLWNWDRARFEKIVATHHSLFYIVLWRDSEVNPLAKFPVSLSNHEGFTTIIALQQHSPLTRQHYPTVRWLSSRCLTPAIVQELVLPFWHQLLTTTFSIFTQHVWPI